MDHSRNNRIAAIPADTQRAIKESDGQNNGNERHQPRIKGTLHPNHTI